MSRLLGAVVLSLILAACSSGSGGFDDDPVATPLAFAANPTPAPIEEPAAEPAPEAKPLAVKVTKRTKSVDRNATASVSIKTAKGAECSIDVEYSSGSATAKGLGEKKANSKGAITWKWKVGGRTTKGKWPIYIYCSKGERSGDVSTSFTVK